MEILFPDDVNSGGGALPQYFNDLGPSIIIRESNLHTFGSEKLNIIERFRVKFTPNGKRQLVARDQVSSVRDVYCSLRFQKYQQFLFRFVHWNRFGLFCLFIFY